MDRKAFLASAAALLIAPAQSAQAAATPITHLPKSKTKRFAWTIDDGVSNSAVRSYLNLAEQTNHHLTFFVTSCYASWKNNSSQIKDLLAQGKIQLANHTLSHRNLVDSSNAIIRNQLLGCHDFLLDEFGYDARPYFRPTYGYWDNRVVSVARELGYTVPVMWRGTLGDTAHVSGQELLDLANQWIVDGQIIVDHANSVKTNYELNQILGITKKRDLKSVTLREAFGRNFR